MFVKFQHMFIEFDPTNLAMLTNDGWMKACRAQQAEKRELVPSPPKELDFPPIPRALAALERI